MSNVGIQYHYYNLRSKFSFEEDQIWVNCQGGGGKWRNPSNLLKVLNIYQLDTENIKFDTARIIRKY